MFGLTALVLTVGLGTWFNAHAERPAPAASTGLTLETPAGDASPEPPVSAPPFDYVIDLNTGAMTPLPESIVRSLGSTREGKRAESQYAASPDGSQLAYVGTGDDGSPQIFIAGVDGVRQVTDDPRGAISPAWSPDAKKIAYTGYGGGDVRNLFVLAVATGETRQVTDGDRDVWDSQFTPDGSSLLYTGGIDEVPLLMTVPVAGGKSTLLIEPASGLPDSSNGSMSPDGSLVTFLGSGTPSSGEPSHCGPCRWVANADGTERRVLPGCFEANPAGTWSPDGSRIACSGGARDRYIIVVDVVTGAASQVAEGNAAIWLDRHTLLVEVPTSPPPSGDGAVELPLIPRRSRIVEGIRFSFQVPTKAWTNGPIESLPDGGFRAGRLLITQSIMGPQGAEAVIFWTSIPDGDRADPCDNLLSPTVGPSTADLANAVATAPGTELVEGPSNVTVGRRPAKHVVLTVRRDRGCDPGFFYTFNDATAGPSWPGTNVGDTIRVWIVDVDGKRLFFEAETTTQADADLEKEIEQIIRSIRFD